ncbi:hypothetical protein DSECCO2_120030 [anaerobic digester metagenome]
MLTSYQLFIQQEKQKAEDWFNKLHQLVITKAEIYPILVKYKRYLEFIGFPYSIIEEMYYNPSYNCVVGVCNYIDEGDTEHTILRINLTKYITIHTKSIPEAKRQLRFHSLLSCMKERTFKHMTKTVNQEIATDILTGQRYVIPNRMGAIGICRIERCFKKNAINFKLTKEERAKGNNTTIYHLEDEYIAAKYFKNYSKMSGANNKIYKFSFTDFCNRVESRKIEEFYPTITSIDDVIEEQSIGNLQKMLAICKFKGLNFYPKINDI